MITLRDFLRKPDVIFGDSPLTSLDMSRKTGNESSHILLFQNFVIPDFLFTLEFSTLSPTINRTLKTNIGIKHGKQI